MPVKKEQIFHNFEDLFQMVLEYVKSGMTISSAIKKTKRIRRCVFYNNASEAQKKQLREIKTINKIRANPGATVGNSYYQADKYFRTINDEIEPD